MKYKFLKSLDLDPEVYVKVSLGLDRIVKGNDNVLLSPIARREEPHKILEGWDHIFNLNKEGLADTILQNEFVNRLSYNPRSLAVPWNDRTPAVDAYFSQNLSRKVPSQELSEFRRLRPLSLKEGVKFLKNSTNSGLPFVTRKGDVKDRLEDAFTMLLDRQDPCLLFTRTQENNKTRNVWGYPVADTLNEMLYYRPLLEYQKKLNWRCALVDPTKVDEAITLMLRKCEAKRKFIVSVDFSQYDATVKPRLQRKAFEYISSLFQKQYEGQISHIADRFATIGLVTPTGIRNGYHGVPSGSTFTNEVDSIVQYLCAKEFGLSDDNMQIQGDDGVYIVDDPDAFFKHMKSYGLNLNEAKSMVSNDECMFLQNYYSLRYVGNNGNVGGIYSTYRALSRIVYPERFTKIEPDEEGSVRAHFAIRTISILENCREHPLFPELVKYIYKLDKYGLAYSETGLRSYIRDLSESTGTEGIFKHHYGDDVKGIRSFQTFRILRRLNEGFDLRL